MERFEELKKIILERAHAAGACREQYGSATVRAYDSATVEASGSAYICSWSVKECQLNDHAVYRIMESNTIRYVDPNIKFEKIGNQ